MKSDGLTIEQENELARAILLRLPPGSHFTLMYGSGDTRGALLTNLSPEHVAEQVRLFAQEMKLERKAKV